jgi:hypothetical protein
MLIKTLMKTPRAPFPRFLPAVFAAVLSVWFLLTGPSPAPAADFEFRGAIDARDTVSRLLKKYVEEFSPEDLFLEIDEQPEGGRFRDLYMDLTGVMIGGVRVDKLIFRMNDVKFNDPSEWDENVECLSTLHIYAYCRLKEEDVNRHLREKTFGRDGHWKNVAMTISPSGLYARGVYSAGFLFFNLNILIEVESGLKIVAHRELWLDDYKARVNTLGVPDYLMEKAVAQIQPLLDLGRFPLPLRLHRVRFGEGEAVLSTRTPPARLTDGITYRYRRER